MAMTDTDKAAESVMSEGESSNDPTLSQRTRKDGPPASAAAPEKRRALGRGLASLLPHSQLPVAGGQLPVAESAAEAQVSVQRTHANLGHPAANLGHPAVHPDEVLEIPVGMIRENEYQTRTFVGEEELQQLADSIRMHGVLQPVVVRPLADGHYMLIMGSRRWQASQKADKATIPAIVRRVSEEQAAEMTIIENLQREDLSSMDEARAFQRLSTVFGQTQEQIGMRMGMARETVSNYMRLLRLPKEVQFLLDKKQLDYSQARQLLRISDATLQIKMAQHVVKRQLSVEQLNALLDRWSGDIDSGKLAPKSKARYVDPNVQAAQRDLERILGVKVKIRDRKGKGKITLEYSSLDEFDRIVTALKGKKKN